MIKIGIPLIILIMLLFPVAYGQIQTIHPIETMEQVNQQHPVFIEYATTTWCPQCPDASNALYELFTSGELPFSYVTLVSDVNPNANLRSRDYKTVAIPTIYVNGGKTLFVGSLGSYESLKNTYIEYITEEADHPINRDISIQSSSTWLGDAKIEINVTITNNENKMYIGKIRTYVNEISSRWLDEQDNPYHYALLDFAQNEQIILAGQSSKSYSVIWDGTDDHQGLTFEDISKENIIIYTAVFHWIPRPRLGYVSFPYIQFFFTHEADAAEMAPFIP